MACIATLASAAALADKANSTASKAVGDDVIAAQQLKLSANTAGKGFGPQSPRDIDAPMGTNTRMFSTAPAYTEMNLCNIHFHKNAEHKGGEFTEYPVTAMAKVMILGIAMLNPLAQMS